MGRNRRLFLPGDRARQVRDVAIAGFAASFLTHLASAGGGLPLPTTIADFAQPGTQPLDSPAEFIPVIPGLTNCSFCHGDYLAKITYDEPWNSWKTSVMAMSARDPIWHAALAIANQDADFSGEYCIRCHAPGAWLATRSVPADGSALLYEPKLGIDDFEGVTCHFCHRLVSPVLNRDSPEQDVDILAALEYPPLDGRGNGRYVVDPLDVRRGPFDDVPINFHGFDQFGLPVEIIYSPFHQSGDLCATCHDLRNPVFSQNPDGSYSPNPPGQLHPTQDPHDMFPEQVTYSEWRNSQFAASGVAFPDGRFGGDHLLNPEFIKAGTAGVMKSCQDCHMPDIYTGGCFAYESDPFFPRFDMPQHSFPGANYWILDAVRAVYSDSVTSLDDLSVEVARERTLDMLRAASDVQSIQLGGELKVRVINFAGHKLPTGYPEGRRMWVNVQFFNESEEIIEEYGAYDFVNAELSEEDTKVYETVHVLNDEVAAETGLPAGTTFHLVLNNEIAFDNRIPPIGFTNRAFESFDGQPFGYVYADGQHWDDTSFDIPSGAETAVITLYYQSTTKEYITFLRDANVTNDAGDLAYDLWADPEVGNKVPPVDMDTVVIALGPAALGDITGDGAVGFADLLQLLNTWGPCPPPDLCAADLNCDGVVGFADLLLLLANWR